MAQTPKKPAPSAALVKMLPIITGVLAVAYAVAAYYLLFMPKIGALLAGGELDLSSYQQRVADDQNYIKALQSAVDAYDLISADAKGRVANMVTKDPDVPDIYVQIDAIARKEGMVLTSIDAVPDDKAVTPAARKVVRIAVNVVGGDYVHFKLFLADLERSERIFDVQSVVFTPASKNYGVVLRAYDVDLLRLLHPELFSASPGQPGTAPSATPSQ